MLPETLPILCDPFTCDPLRLEDSALVNVKSGKKYPLRDGIPIFEGEADVAGLNKKYQRLYDRYAFLYDPALAALSRIVLGKSDVDLRRGLLERFLASDGTPKIDRDTRVLEVSVGTGHNILALPDTGKYYGLDISWGMLMRCRKNMAKYARSVELFQGNAERLPFVDDAFDVVFHVGGINFFNDKAKAIAEMARVARPGTKLLISDETEKVIGRSGRLPVVGRFYRGKEKMAAAPADLVPENMKDVRVDLILKGTLYVLTFVKP